VIVGHSVSETALLPDRPLLFLVHLRKNQAQWVGLNTPQNTIQSFLWTLQNRDVNRLRQVLTPESEQQLLGQGGATPEKFFDETSVLPGLRIVRERPVKEDAVLVVVEYVPGQPFPDPLHLWLIDGQWRLDLRH
jgi:hypothetical protein